MKEILIFCQAPADIQYALTIYDENKKSMDISIYCINVEGMFNFLESLKLNLKQLVFIPYDIYLSYKNPIKIFRARRKLISLYKRYFESNSDNDIYFFSHFFDFITFFMVAKLSKKNKVIFVNHYDDAICKNYKRPKLSIRYLKSYSLYKLNTGIDFKFYQFNKRFIPEFNLEKYKIEELKENILDKKVFKLFSYKIKNNNKKSILYLEMDYKKSNFIDNYEKVTIDVMKIIKSKGYYIYLKAHPRLGYSNFLNEYVDDFINQDIPAEFIDVQKFDYILGISSSAIAFFSKISNVKVFSLLELYQYNSEDVKKRAIQYLCDLSDNLEYFDSLNDLDNKIK